MRRTCSVSFAVVCLTLSGAASWADVVVEHPFLGVTHFIRRDSDPNENMHIVQIDLTAPGLAFKLTPHGGTRDTVRQRTVDFLHQESAQIAVNVHFMVPYGSDADQNVVGLAASLGEVYSPFEPQPIPGFTDQSYAIVRYGPGLNIVASNHAMIVHRDASYPDNKHVVEAVTLYNAVSGSAQVITNGLKSIPDYLDANHPDGLLNPINDYSNDPNDSWYDLWRARTVIGLSADNSILTIFTADSAGGSTGMPYRLAGTVADILISDYQVYNALNLDGGGSTSLAMEDPNTHVRRLVNVTADTDPNGRAVGSNLAIWALPRNSYCHIAGEWYVDGTSNPDNACEYCNAGTNPDAWSTRDDGHACDDASYCNGHETCQSGVCRDGADPCPLADCSEMFDACRAGSMALIVPAPPQQGQQGTIYTVDLVIDGLTVPVAAAQAAVHFDHSQLGFLSFTPNSGVGWSAPYVSTSPLHLDDVVIGAFLPLSSVGPGGPFTVGTLRFRGLVPGTPVVGIVSAAPWDPGMITELVEDDTTIAFAPATATGTAAGQIVIRACDDGRACSIDTFNGTACVATLAPIGTTCRAAAGECDIAEVCDGVSMDCPADEFQPALTACGGAPTGVCDAQDMCDGNGTCVTNFQPSTTVCRAAAGDCDIAETCTGSDAACPQDLKAGSGTVCRAAADVCDVAETCDGSSNDCPADEFKPSGTECRAAAGECDVAEVCNGVSNACPTDAFVPAGTPCGDTSDGDCSAPDECDGAGVCQPNHASDGTACDDGQFCTDGETCTSGVCGDGSPHSCDDALECTTDVCDETADTCTHDRTESWVMLQIEGLGVYEPPVTRTVTFVVTRCPSTRQTIPVSVAFTSNPIRVVIPGIDPGANWIQATEGHTLSALMPLNFSGCEVANFTGSGRLLAGDFSNPPSVPQTTRVDIQDFAILAVFWNQPIDANLGYRADATGNGVQDVGDFTAIQANFGVVGQPADHCTTLSGTEGQPMPWGIEPPQNDPFLAVSEDDGLRMPTAALGLPHVDRADCNGDGWVDLRDVRIFAWQNGLTLLPSFAGLIDLYEEAHAPEELEAGALFDE